jgi:hypothetical protein
VLGAPATILGQGYYLGVGALTLLGSGPSFCQSFIGLFTVNQFALVQIWSRLARGAEGSTRADQPPGCPQRTKRAHTDALMQI